MKRIPQWTRFEEKLDAGRRYEDPTQEVEIRVAFSHSGSETRSVRAFWDGGNLWRFRFSPDREGQWTWRTHSADPAFDGRRGKFVCVAYSGANPLYTHGALRVAGNRRHFEHADGTPFLWIGDTVWNGPLKATPRDWRVFLRDRVAKGFNAIQFVPTQWVAGAGNADLRHAYVGTDSIRIDPSFFQWLDLRVDAINEHGMLAVPALIWSAPSKPWALGLNPGTYLPEDQIIVLARYLIARYGAHHAAWMLAGDGDYRGPLAGQWQRIGRAVIEDNSHLATMHPMGRVWVGAEFRGEPWFQFHGYQSSHWGSQDSLRWITEGPPHTDWAAEPRHPVLNLEPCYEAHLDMCGAPAEGRLPFDDHAVRRACYWSLLASPPAGVTYGAHGVWGWELSRQTPMNHTATGVAPAWREGMRLPGSAQMKILREFFESIPWWTLLPAQEMLASQPGVDDAQNFVSAARSEDGSLALLYLPAGGAVALRPGAMPEGTSGEWIEALSGARSKAGTGVSFTAPGPGDWLLLLRAETAS